MAASGDPHLMRLGHYLAWVDRHAGWTLDDIEYLEDQFQEEPWMNWVQVVMADGPEKSDAPFVLLANSDTNNQRSHANCPINNKTVSREQKKVGA